MSVGTQMGKDQENLSEEYLCPSMEGTDNNITIDKLNNESLTIFLHHLKMSMMIIQILVHLF